MAIYHMEECTMHTRLTIPERLKDFEENVKLFL